MIAIIDYDAGNLKSVEKALIHLGHKVMVSSDPDTIIKADKVILPGVGAFGDCMEKLKQYELIDVIHDSVDMGKPFLGICLGLQLLYGASEESEGAKGLGILQGQIRKIPYVEGYKVPHMGWNSIELRQGARLFKGVENNSYVYFVHSYFLTAEDERDVAASTFYNTRIHASVERDNVFACQFHPEKSGEVGLKILNNFARL